MLPGSQDHVITKVGSPIKALDTASPEFSVNSDTQHDNKTILLVTLLLHLLNIINVIDCFTVAHLGHEVRVIPALTSLVGGRGDGIEGAHGSCASAPLSRTLAGSKAPNRLVPWHFPEHRKRGRLEPPRLDAT